MVVLPPFDLRGARSFRLLLSSALITVAIFLADDWLIRQKGLRVALDYMYDRADLVLLFILPNMLFDLATVYITVQILWKVAYGKRGLYPGFATS